MSKIKVYYKMLKILDSQRPMLLLFSGEQADGENWKLICPVFCFVVCALGTYRTLTLISMLLPFGIFIYCTTIDFYKDTNGHYIITVYGR